jgi:hypothetical protein
MFLVTKADADAIRTAFEADGEFAAAVELRRRFRGIADNEMAREHVRAIMGRKPLPRSRCPNGGLLASSEVVEIRSAAGGGGTV